MRQTESEMFQMGAAFHAAAVKELCDQRKCEPGEVTPQDVDAHILARAEEAPLVFLMVGWMRLRNAVYGVVDSKNDGPVGNFRQYLELLPVLQKIFVMTNATSYVHLVNAEIARWLVASENEKKVHAARGHVKISESGASRLWGDEAGEHVQGVMRDFLGHHYRQGKESLIANVGWHLQRLSQVRTQQREGGGSVGASVHGDAREREVELEDAFWGPYKLLLDRQVLRLGADIVVGGFVGSKRERRSVPCGTLVTLAGEPMSGHFLHLFNTSQERCDALAEAHANGVTGNVCVRKVAYNARAECSDAQALWDQQYSTVDAVLQGLTKKLRGELLVKLKVDWPATLDAPSVDGSGETLVSMGKVQLRGSHQQKPFSNEQQATLLSKARILWQTMHPPPTRPQAGQFTNQSLPSGFLRGQLRTHALFRPLGCPEGTAPPAQWATDASAMHTDDEPGDELQPVSDMLLEPDVMEEDAAPAVVQPAHTSADEPMADAALDGDGGGAALLVRGSGSRGRKRAAEDVAPRQTDGGAPGLAEASVSQRGRVQKASAKALESSSSGAQASDTNKGRGKGKKKR